MPASEPDTTASLAFYLQRQSKVQDFQLPFGLFKELSQCIHLMRHVAPHRWAEVSRSSWNSLRRPRGGSWASREHKRCWVWCWDAGSSLRGWESRGQRRWRSTCGLWCVMEKSVSYRVASNSRHLRIKEIQVQLIVLKERTRRCCCSLLPLLQRWHCYRGREIYRKNRCWEASSKVCGLCQGYIWSVI